MKNIYSKNTIVALSILTNVAFTGYLLSTKFKLFINPSVAIAAPVPTSLTKKTGSVEGVSTFKSNQLQSCYNALLRRNPEVDEGIVQLHMKIDKNGAINHLELVKNDLQDEVFTQCVLNEVRGQRFPASAAKVGQLISHKFKFYRKDHAQMNFED